MHVTLRIRIINIKWGKNTIIYILSHGQINVTVHEERDLIPGSYILQEERLTRRPKWGTPYELWHFVVLWKLDDHK